MASRNLDLLQPAWRDGGCFKRMCVHVYAAPRWCCQDSDVFKCRYSRLRLVLDASANAKCMLLAWSSAFFFLTGSTRDELVESKDDAVCLG